MFIVIDGIDGSGKGTQLKLVCEKLTIMGKKVKVLDFPRYGNPSAFFVEKYLNGGYGKDVSAKLASLFYALDRFDDSHNIKQYIEEYDYVISNRYVSASMIHQTGKIKDEKEVDVFLEWLSDLEYTICSIPKPDKIIFLDVPPVISQKLIEKKEQRDYIKGGANKDIHEDDEYHLKNAYEKAIYAANKFGWSRIECVKEGEMLPIDSITHMILQEIV